MKNLCGDNQLLINVSKHCSAIEAQSLVAQLKQADSSELTEENPAASRVITFDQTLLMEVHDYG
jgi:hypothetical protein